jgi:hypothetical protein
MNDILLPAGPLAESAAVLSVVDDSTGNTFFETFSNRLHVLITAENLGEELIRAISNASEVFTLEGEAVVSARQWLSYVTASWDPVVNGAGVAPEPKDWSLVADFARVVLSSLAGSGLLAPVGYVGFNTAVLDSISGDEQWALLFLVFDHVLIQRAVETKDVMLPPPFQVEAQDADSPLAVVLAWLRHACGGALTAAGAPAPTAPLVVRPRSVVSPVARSPALDRKVSAQSRKMQSLVDALFAKADVSAAQELMDALNYAFDSCQRIDEISLLVEACVKLISSYRQVDLAVGHVSTLEEVALVQIQKIFDANNITSERDSWDQLEFVILDAIRVKYDPLAAAVLRVRRMVQAQSSAAKLSLSFNATIGAPSTPAKAPPSSGASFQAAVDAAVQAALAARSQGGGRGGQGGGRGGQGAPAQPASGGAPARAFAKLSVPSAAFGVGIDMATVMLYNATGPRVFTGDTTSFRGRCYRTVRSWIGDSCISCAGARQRGRCLSNSCRRDCVHASFVAKIRADAVLVA